jgi:hypothetical protein
MDADTQRMLELRQWLRTVAETCPWCSLRLAIVAVEMEHRRQVDLPRACCAPEHGRDEHGRRIELETCESKARAIWDSRPKAMECEK